MIKLLNDYVLITIKQPTEGTKFELAEQDIEIPTTGTVFALSLAPNNEDSMRKISCLEKGDVVRFRKGLKNNFKHEGQDYLLCGISDIIGVVNEDKGSDL